MSIKIRIFKKLFKIIIFIIYYLILNIITKIDIMNYNELFNRQVLSNKIKDLIININNNKHDLLIKKGIYLYGASGIGKTTFITNILKELNYDIILYNSSDIRNKTTIENITKYNMSDTNVASMFNKKQKPIAIIMDEIDGMNSGDKGGGINLLIKLLRPKKTKKQKLEDLINLPLICVSNYHKDKKIKELMKTCNCFELKKPTYNQIYHLIKNDMKIKNNNIITNLINYIDYDLKKYINILKIYNESENVFNHFIMNNILQNKLYTEDTKELVNNLYNCNYNLNQHNYIINETDRTIVGLLWHENIIDLIENKNTEKNITYTNYEKILNNICFCDYIDRITFQKQIWQFNEMSSLLKTFLNNNIYNTQFKKSLLKEIRFTKVLTKYSTEYNNIIFINRLCEEFNLDYKDLISYFLKIKNNKNIEDIFTLFENNNINKLDIKRIYRYIELQ